MNVSQISYPQNVINNQNSINYQLSFQGAPKESALHKIDTIPKEFKQYILAETKKRRISIEPYIELINSIKSAGEELKENLTKLVKSCHKDTTVDIGHDSNYRYHLVFQNRNLPDSAQIQRNTLYDKICFSEFVKNVPNLLTISKNGVLSEEATNILYKAFSIIQLNQLTHIITELNKKGNLSKDIDKILFAKGKKLTPCNTIDNISILEFFKRLYRSIKLDKLARDLNFQADCTKTLLKTTKEHIINRVKRIKLNRHNRTTAN